jgi:hypothetical protein
MFGLAIWHILSLRQKIYSDPLDDLVEICQTIFGVDETLMSPHLSPPRCGLVPFIGN